MLAIEQFITLILITHELLPTCPMQGAKGKTGSPDVERSWSGGGQPLAAWCSAVEAYGLQMTVFVEELLAGNRGKRGRANGVRLRPRMRCL